MEPGEHGREVRPVPLVDLGPPVPWVLAQLSDQPDGVGRPNGEMARRAQLAVTPGDVDGAASPLVELGACQVHIGTPASLSADFTVHA